MRNLLFGILCFLLFCYSAGAQTLKVEGYAGNIGNYITQFYGNYFTVERNDGYAVINLNGKTMSSGIKAPVVDFSRILSIYGGVYFADNAGDISLKNINGQPLGTDKFMEIRPFETDNTVVWVRSAPGSMVYAYIDTAGKEIVRFDIKKYLAITDPLTKPASFASVSLYNYLPFSEGLTPIKSRVSGKYGFINKKLQLVIPVSFKEACPFSDGLAAVKNGDGNWGFINTMGQLIIQYDYSRRPSRFMSGLARVENKEGKLGYINKMNSVVVTPRYTYATCFYKGFALAREGYNRPVYLIDTTGVVVATFPKDVLYIDNARPGAGISGSEQPDYPFYVSETLRQLVDEGKGIFMKGMDYGLIDNKGNIVLDFKYQYLSNFHNGKVFAHSSAFINNSTRNDFGIINEKGEWIAQIVSSRF